MDPRKDTDPHKRFLSIEKCIQLKVINACFWKAPFNTFKCSWLQITETLESKTAENGGPLCFREVSCIIR